MAVRRIPARGGPGVAAIVLLISGLGGDEPAKPGAEKTQPPVQIIINQYYSNSPAGQGRPVRPPEAALPAVALPAPATAPSAPPAPPRPQTIDEFLAPYADIKPLPPAPIPDDPPPHEGAMIDIPIVIEPPDLIDVEVLQALPGRGIGGERLVRPDGTISLGFYGDVHVRGLTAEQAKVKILMHLRKFLKDEVLGVIEYMGSIPEQTEAPNLDSPTPEEMAPTPTRPTDPAEGQPMPEELPTLPPPETNPFNLESNEPPKTRPTAARRRARPVRRASGREAPGGSPAPATVNPDQAQDAQIPPPPPNTDLGNPSGLPGVSDEPPPDIFRHVPPAESDRVFVDITAYNSKVYYVVGDVNLVGRFPISGQETVMDAIEYAGELSPTADPENIRLIRPARGEKPAKVYKIDLAAIKEKGDPRANLQLFPGDRIIVGRNPVVKTTVEFDRRSAPMAAMLNSMLTYAYTMRQLGSIDLPIGSTTASGLQLKIGGLNVNLSVTPDRPIDPARREAVLKAWAEFFRRSMPADSPSPEEKEAREILIRQLLDMPMTPKSDQPPGRK